MFFYTLDTVDPVVSKVSHIVVSRATKGAAESCQQRPAYGEERQTVIMDLSSTTAPPKQPKRTKAATTKHQARTVLKALCLLPDRDGPMVPAEACVTAFIKGTAGYRTSRSPQDQISARHVPLSRKRLDTVLAVWNLPVGNTMDGRLPILF
jgi:hypothetical protein